MKIHIIRIIIKYCCGECYFSSFPHFDQYSALLIETWSAFSIFFLSWQTLASIVALDWYADAYTLITGQWLGQDRQRVYPSLLSRGHSLTKKWLFWSKVIPKYIQELSSIDNLVNKLCHNPAGTISQTSFLQKMGFFVPILY